MSERDSFRVEGVGCWCPPESTLYALRIMGHTESCTQARKGWEANCRHLSQIDKQRRADQEAGRQLREAATALVSNTDSVPRESA